jgi:hypothetical protein
MLWAPTVTEELRNDVRFALRFKVGRKQQPLSPARAAQLIAFATQSLWLQSDGRT